MKSTKCVVFDAYGTLFDVDAVVGVLEGRFPGKSYDISKAWRTRQLEYTWLRSLIGLYEDFWKITESTLVATCNAMKLPLDVAARDEVMEAYLHLNPFPDVKQALSALSGTPLAILSNGSPKMLESVVKNAGLDGAFSQVISVDEVKTYKPSPSAYRLAVKQTETSAANIEFVSSNFFDVAGAKAFGFRTYWINRSGAPADELGITPDSTLKSLTDLVALVRR